jgi:exopolysaccharide biosynthesis polyprenyl glycosylphosphotransferase
MTIGTACAAILGLLSRGVHRVHTTAARARRIVALIRRHLFALRLMLLAADFVTAALLFLVVGQFRFGEEAWPTVWHALDVDLRIGAVLYAAAWVVTLWFLGLYGFRARWTVASELDDIVVASLMLAFGTMTFLYLVKLDVSRLFLLILLVAQPIVTMASRVVLRGLFSWLRKRGYNRCFMLVVGTGEGAQTFADAVEGHRELGIEVLGHLRAPNDAAPVVSRPILGDGEDIVRLFHERVVDEVAICVDAADTAWATPLIRLAADEGKHVRIPTAAPARSFDLQTEELDGLVIRSVVNGPARMLSLAFKRAMDVVGALLGLVILSPLVLAVAIAIVVRDGPPVHYHHTRIGLHGRPFTMHKFRTMVRDADDRFDEVRHLNERSDVTFKAADDPRITRLGRFLRATSIDELPQLWNVLKGEMSLVGPRPPLEREIVHYDVWHRRRLSMKPGVTGLWQVEARTEPAFDRWVERDLAYIDQWSIGLDIRILIRTIPAVFARTGK